MTALNEFNQELWDLPSIHTVIARAMSREDAATFKFDADMIAQSHVLGNLALFAVEKYEGSWDLMVKFHNLDAKGHNLSPAQLAVALNSVLNCWRRSLKEVAAKQQVATINDEEYDFSQVQLPQQNKGGNVGQVVTRPHDGTYTFIHNNSYRVLKFDTYKKSGEQFVSYQNGSDNTVSFAKCGKITVDGDLILWGSAYSKGEQIPLNTTQRADLRAAIEFMCGMGAADQLKAGEAYALKSGHCFICGLKITTPSSLSAGMGPICSESWAAKHSLQTA